MTSNSMKRRGSALPELFFGMFTADGTRACADERLRGADVRLGPNASASLDEAAFFLPGDAGAIPAQSLLNGALPRFFDWA